MNDEEQTLIGRESNGCIPLFIADTCVHYPDKGSKNISHASSKLTPCFLAFVVAFASSRQNAASDKGTRHPLNLCIYNVYLAGQAPSLPTH
jgi:hypothetical protein